MYYNSLDITISIKNAGTSSSFRYFTNSILFSAKASQLLIFQKLLYVAWKCFLKKDKTYYFSPCETNMCQVKPVFDNQLSMWWLIWRGLGVTSDKKKQMIWITKQISSICQENDGRFLIISSNICNGQFWQREFFVLYF